MKYFYLLLIFSVALVGCEEDEPFEYPDDPIEPEQTIISHFERDMTAPQFDLWTLERKSMNCESTGVEPAFFEYDSSQNEIVLHLIPDSNICDLGLTVHTDIAGDEVVDKEWSELNFEFFFSEYIANANTELWLSLYYKNVELELDLVPFIEDVGLGEGGDGTFKVAEENGNIYFELSGVRINPGFDDGSGNHFSNTGSGASNFFEIRLDANGTSEQSLLLFKYLRLYSLGVQE